MSTKTNIPSDSASIVTESLQIRNLRDAIESDNSFEETLSKLEKVVKPIMKDGAMTPQQAMLAVQTLQNVAIETIKYTEEQKTRREEIRAMKDVAIARIQSMRECVQDYLNKTFDERSEIFAKQFDCVDAALKSGDNEPLTVSLNSINSLAASSPFKNLADLAQVQKSLISSDTEWDI